MKYPIRISYSQNNTAKVQEDQVRNLIYLLFKLLEIEMQVECNMIRGRSDAVVWTQKRIYVFEFKVDSTPQIAIDQILKCGYAELYRTDGREVILIGINYSTSDRTITGWEIR